ncbi:MAG TPA: PA domain-containing protein, partial [Candidatus Limnocylindria bacterium]|nr:PA domain-containing protein [Candidatus Limnocylindria bacterium]
AYVVTVDNFGTENVDILDITNPHRPRLIAEYDLNTAFGPISQPELGLHESFLHDMVVKKIDGRWIMLLSYWDGGYVVVDVTDLPSRPKLVGWTNFGAVEPFAAQMGLPADWTPEGNAHQAEFSFDNKFILAADEDFGAVRLVGLISGGRYAGDRFSGTMGSDVPPIDEEHGLAGGTTYVGDACTPVAPAASPNQIALIERGTCTFTIKLQVVQAAGYAAGIVFNDRATDANCDAQIFMLAIGDIPFMFVGRSVGLKLMDVAFDNPCETLTPPPLSPSVEVSIIPIFDGWGYVHLYDARTFKTLAHWALPEAIDPAYATGFGTLSVHEVATDPRRNRAYVSHYSGGLRVLDFGRGGIKEVGAYIDAAGNNFWGVEVHYMPGASEPIVLASDRDSGLWIFQYKPGASGGKKKP